jgi:hypothetical protein
MGGAGWLGIDRSVGVARQHPAQVKSLALLSGETVQDGLQIMRQASQLPGLYVVADDDEYPPTVESALHHRCQPQQNVCALLGGASGAMAMV